jgi:hypothetical protein
MKLGGNARAKAFFKKHGIADLKASAKYNSSHAKQYKSILKSEVDKALGLNLKPHVEEEEEEVVKSAPDTTAAKNQDDWFEDVMEQSPSKPVRTQENKDEDQVKVKTATQKNNFSKKLAHKDSAKKTASIPAVDVSKLKISEKETFQPAFDTSSKKNNKHNEFEDWDAQDYDDSQTNEEQEGWDNWGDEDTSNGSAAKNKAGQQRKSSNKNTPQQHHSTARATPEQYDDSDNYAAPPAKSNKYVGIASPHSQKPISNANVQLSDLSASDMAWYLTEQAKDKYQIIAEKTTEYGSFVAEQASKLSDNVSEAVTKWFSNLAK